MSDYLETISFDDALILIRDQCEIIVLNESAQLIWMTIAAGRSAADAAEKLVDRYGLSRPKARSDVNAALAEWRTRGLIDREATTVSREERVSDPSPAVIRTAQIGFERRRTYELCGRPVSFLFCDPELEGLIHPLLSASEVPDSGVADAVVLRRDGVEHVIEVQHSVIGRSDSAEEVLALALGQLLEVSYPNAQWLGIFHAAVVADDRQAIMLPGASGSGKSTLTAALVHAGLRYLSDDVAPLEGSRLHVMPVPFMASLKRGSWPVVAPWFPELDGLPTHGHGWRQRRYLNLSRDDGEIQLSGMPVGALVFPEYQPSGPTRMVRLRPREALELLLKAGGWVSLDLLDLSRMLEWLSSRPSYQLGYGSIQDATMKLRDVCSI